LIDKISYVIHPDRALQYDKDDVHKFKELFDAFDEDKSGYLSRAEMS
jgi:Ca2+-binding EF-hand superfamily protein